MTKKRVLIFPAGTEIAFEIQNALKYSKFVELYGVNSIPSHAEFVFRHCVPDLPFVSNPDFIPRLNEVIALYGIDYIFPAHDSVCLTLAREQKNINAAVVSSPLKTVEICRSKNRTYNYFKGEDFLPKFYSSAEDVSQFPVFIKPDVGQGSAGAKMIGNREELSAAVSDGIDYAICEYLPGDEFTVDCFTDRHGKLRCCHLRKRERIKTGISVRSSLFPTDSAITDVAEEINSKLEFNGAWFFQVKKNSEGEYRLMEISPRIPGTMGVSRNLGINYPLLTLYNMWGYDVDIIDNGLQITLDRAFISRYKTDVSYRRVYTDFDDTLYLGNEVNIQMVTFLYQCVNKGIPVTLLTKHDGDILSALKDFRISSDLFDDIVHIGKDRDKSEYITEMNSIYIDDSFSERLNIHRKLGIPVYDLDMIESLIDWRM